MTLNIALTPKKSLLIGAGSAAKLKHMALSGSKFNVKIIASSVNDGYFSDKEVEILALNERNLEQILGGFELIVDASGDKNLGQFLHLNRKKFNYLLNVVDKPLLCDFYFTANVTRGALSVGVSSDGASPILAQKVRDKIDKILPSNLGEINENLRVLRQKSKIDKDEISKSVQKALGKVLLISCGPNSLNTLTIEAYEALSLIDIALVDNLVGDEILQILKERDVEIVSVAKVKGKHSKTQDEINELMLKFALTGKVVGRLKGGDTAIFARVGEECSFLDKNGIDYEIVSGVSSALAGAINAGITPTLRDVSSGVLVVSAHLRETLFNASWLSLLNTHDFTLIVLMAHSFADKILSHAKALEVDLTTPCAFVSRIGFSDEMAVFGELESLEKMAKLSKRPAILIIGKSVKHTIKSRAKRVDVE